MRPTHVGSQHISATQTALCNESIVQGIIDASDAADFRKLETVSHAFHGAVNRPSMWVRQYAPATVSHRLRAVYTSSPAIPRNRWNLYAPLSLPKVFEGEQWHIRTGPAPDYRSDPQNRERLLRVIFNKPHNVLPGGNPYHTALEPETGMWDFEHELQEAYTFLLERGYRRACGQQNIDVRSAVSVCIVALLIGLDATAYHVLTSFDDQVGLARRIGMMCWFAVVTEALVLCSQDTARYLRINHYADLFYQRHCHRGSQGDD